MPGRTNKKPLSELERVQEEIRRKDQTIREYEKIIARVDAEAVLKRLPEPLDEYEPDLPKRVLALSALGMFTREIRAELGIDAKQWSSWRTAHAEFYAATLRAKDLAGAYWYGLARKSLEWKDWKLPYNQLIAMIKAMQDDDQDTDRGDASALVIFNKQKGRDAIDAKAGKPTPLTN